MKTDQYKQELKDKFRTTFVNLLNSGQFNINFYYEYYIAKIEIFQEIGRNKNEDERLHFDILNIYTFNDVFRTYRSINNIYSGMLKELEVNYIYKNNDIIRYY